MKQGMLKKSLLASAVGFCMPALLLASTISIAVEGMFCAFCAQGITKNFEQVAAVEKVDVDLDHKIVTLKTNDKSEVSDGQIKKIIEDSGFRIKKIDR